MRTAIKSAITTCTFLATTFASLSANAAGFVFSGTGASGGMGAVSFSNGYMFMQVTVSENTNRTSSNNTSSTGAFFFGINYSGSGCWFGYNTSNTVEFKKVGSLPNQVIASGQIPVTWQDWCNFNPPVNDTVSFTMNLNAIRNQGNRHWGTTNDNYGTLNVIRRYDYSSAPAVANASSISSPIFGIVTPTNGDVGQSVQNEVDISQ